MADVPNDLDSIVHGLIEFLYSIAGVSQVDATIMANDRTHRILVTRKLSKTPVCLNLLPDLTLNACLGYSVYREHRKRGRNMAVDLMSPQSMGELRQFVSIVDD